MTTHTLIGTYTPPAVRKGDRVFCLYRDCECVVSSWTNARISWPRVGVRGQQGGSGLWIDETLLRAIQTESAVALKYWFGVGDLAVWNWRKAFGITRTGSEGSRRLHHEGCKRGGESTKAKEWTEEELALKHDRALDGMASNRWAGKRWTAEMDARLGTEEDEVLAREWGKTTTAVRVRRSRLRIPKLDDQRKR